ncbi:hypothetical protein Oweho_3451 [Owenweeksia hongkongensis DSM 17368]|uniref:Lipoprotein n=1 Tax=Owenweeksia hongkongensis (strain DSM 17368 / CIP 108786 / JCM 12287 / NRRL B-23963 / UST20020801) TaxID=926562 RepID=G8R5T4_OWEHD|nr:hypothetical protein [Owenweeksia hongkongensis]AEV34400.1 hypothetical protein Oweho_3451 [Owenweeksia hongkongensis DSM 17368]
MKKVMIVASVALMVACQPNAGESEEKGHQHEHGTQSKSEPHIHESSGDSNVKLNNGKRWEGNAETTEGINNMLVLGNNFDEETQAYDQLQVDLQNEFRTIFKKCTMTGEAHDQLHNYLIPLKAKIEKVTGDNLTEIRDYLKTYKNYFQ